MASPGDSVRVYTNEHPLVFEGEWDLLPYTFLNENGQPDGYSVELVNLLLDELGIPHVVKLKQPVEAYNDLKEGRADLMLGLAMDFHDEYGKYGKKTLSLFTQSVVTPKGKPVLIKRFKDLSDHKVIVRDSGLCHHLMIDYGWGDNAITYSDIREAVRELSIDEDGQLVWNTASLKWLLHHHHIDNLEMTPVNMHYGEYKFISNDQHLLDMLDEAYSRLETSDKVERLRQKWFYPEINEKPTQPWLYVMAALGALLVVVLVVYTVTYRIQERKLSRLNQTQNSRLTLIIEASQVNMWTYDIKANQIAWRSENGQPLYTYTMEEFAQRYSPEDFLRLRHVLDELAASRKLPGDKEQEHTLELMARDTESGSDELRDYVISLSVLNRDKNGTATVIIGTKKDITKLKKKQREDEQRTRRYWALFNTQLLGVLFFNKEGVLVDINPKACEMYGCQADEILAEHVRLTDVIDTGDLPLEQLNGFATTQFIDLDKLSPSQYRVKSVSHKGRLCNEYKLMTVTADNGQLIGIFAVCRDITSVVTSMAKTEQATQLLSQTKAVLGQYEHNIDTVLHGSDLRLATYSPTSHTLTIHRSVSQIQHVLTQTRCMTLVDDHSKKQAMRLLNDMDQRIDRNIDVSIRTTLRGKDRRRLELRFCLMPLHGRDGQVTDYLGLLLDQSELADIAQQTEEKLAKVEEVEATKNSFINNMVQEIRTPMNTVTDFVAQLGTNQAKESEEMLTAGILKNADQLIHLIDNILYLSRLEASMVEINKQPCDFAEIFSSLCMNGWAKYQNDKTSYIVDNPYEQLVVDIDATNLGNAIAQLTANAAQHTATGVVRTRYDYIGRRLMITIDDTGEGIDQAEMERINQIATGGVRTTKGLGLAITKELVRQMGGTVDINSEKGLGTTVYVTIPCQATVVKRKKTIERETSATKRAITTLLIALLSATPLWALSLRERYTNEHPVVIVCDLDKPPYEFLNSQGEPAGSNIDVMRAVLKELELPCTFVMKEWTLALKTFERGKADIVLANEHRYKKSGYAISSNILNYNRIRVAMYGDSVANVSLKKLKEEGAVFKPGDYTALRFREEDSSHVSAMEYQSPKMALTGLVNGDYKYYVWGEEPLKWKIRELNLEGITLNECAIPPSEIHIIGHDHQLIEQIDDQFSRMKQNGVIAAIQDHWLHPERASKERSFRAVYATLAALFALALVWLLSRLARTHARMVQRKSTELNDMMLKALHMGNYKVMVYDVANDLIVDRYGNTLPEGGITLEEFTRRIHPNQQQEFTQKMKRLLNGRERHFELDKLWNAGTDDDPHWLIFQGRAAVELDNHGHAAYVVNVIHDITQDMEQDRAAQELERKYECLVNMPFVAVSFYDKGGKFISANDTMQELCGMDKSPDVKRFWEKTSMFDVALFRGIYNANEHNDLLFCQHMLYPELGLDRYIECHIQPLLDDSGEVANYFINTFNLTSQRQHIRQLYAMERESKDTLEQIGVKKDQLTYLLLHGERYLVRLDVAKQTAVFFRQMEKPEYTHTTDSFCAMLCQADRQPFMELFGSNPPLTTHHMVLHLDHTTNQPKGAVLDMTLEPCLDSQGAVVAYTGTATNVTSLSHARQHLQEMTTLANDSLRRKSGFMASMTHELRTPLNAIVGFTSVLQAMSDTPERAEYLRIIRNSSDMLRRLIDDIIEASTYTISGTMTIVPEKVNFSAAFEDICLTLEKRMQEPEVKFIKDNPYSTLNASVDTNRIQQVLTNFVTNAVKFTKKGHIRLGYRYQDQGLYFYCEDTGKGIPKAQQAIVFDRFVKLDEFVQGTGMGLYICKQIAQSYHGRIGVDSLGQDKGSTFWMWIPCTVEEPAK